MKYLRSSIFLSGLFVAASATLCLAKDSPKRAGETPRPPVMGGMYQDLGLSEDQSKKLEAASEAQRASIQTLMEQRRTIATKLDSQLQKKAGDAELEATLKEMRANQKAIMGAGEQLRDQQDVILTPTQRAKMLQGHGMPGPMGGPMRHPPQPPMPQSNEAPKK